MILKNIQLAVRSILKNRGISAINIAGLALGMMAVLIIFQYINFEKSYDRFFENSDRIHRLVFYRFYQTGLDRSVGNNYYIGQIAADRIPEIEKFCRVKKLTQYVQAGEQIFKEERTLFADSSFFEIFSHQLVSGNRSELLNKPGVAVITESTARKYFGNDDPIGRTIYGVNPGKKPVTVQGVIKDVPQNSHLKFDLAISLSTLINNSYCYSCNNTNTYLLIRQGADIEEIGKKITDLGREYIITAKIAVDFPIEYHLQPVQDIHLFSSYRFEHEINGNNKYVTILMVIAVLILLSAGLNYFNLFSSVTGKRFDGIGIRLINGASLKEIIYEFTTETIITSVISFVLAVILLFFLFPSFSNFLDLDFSLSSVFRFKTLLFPFLALILISIISGWLCAVRIYAANPVSFIKKEGHSGLMRGSRKYLVTGQFLISIILITCTLVAIKQIRHMQRNAFTMDISQTLVVRRPVASEFNSAQVTFQQNMLQYPWVKDLTFSTISPGEKNDWVKGGISLKGKNRLDYQFFQANVAPDFFDFFDVQLLAGRQFFEDENNWTGGQRHLIINKEAASALGMEDVKDLIGKTLFDYDSAPQQDLGEIVGVIDGYFQNSLDQEVKPTIFNCDQGGYYIFMKVGGENLTEILGKTESEFRKNFKDQYFEYYFLDDFFNAQYKSHVQLFRCFLLFSIMALVITNLSLFGLIIMSSVSRTKEIGIRKVNGARITELLLMLNSDHLIWIAVAYVIAVPVAWFAMNRWLQNFAYRTSLDWWIFLLAGLCALAIALLTVSWQSWRTATRNPVEALRYE